jgi:hypothetical protein
MNPPTTRAALPPTPLLPAELRARVLAAAARVPAPTRARTRARNVVLAVVGAATPLGVFLYMDGLRQGTRPDRLLFSTAGTAALMALVACTVAFGRGRSMLGRKRWLLLSLTTSLPLVLLVTKIGISARFPDMMNSWDGRPGYRCLGLGCLLAPVPLAAALLARRGSSPAHPSLSGAAMGAGVGSCVWLLVDLWCPVAYVPHLFLGHLLPVLLTTAAGTLAGARLLDLPGLGPTPRAAHSTVRLAGFRLRRRA